MSAKLSVIFCIFFTISLSAFSIRAQQTALATDTPAAQATPTQPAPQATQDSDFTSLRNEMTNERENTKTQLSQQWDYIKLFIACFTVLLAIISIAISVIGGLGYWKSLRLDKKAKEFQDICSRVESLQNDINKKIKEIDIDLTFNQFITEAAARVDVEFLKMQAIRNAEEEKKTGEELSPGLQKQIEDIVKNIVKTPEEDRSATDYSLMALETEDLEEKIDLYTKAIKLKPDDATAYYFRGSAYREKSKYDLAIQNYDEAIKWESDYIAAFYFKACALARRGKEGDREEAFKALEEAARLGLIHIEFIREDKELDSLRDDPRFDEILKKIEENAEKKKGG